MENWILLETRQVKLVHLQTAAGSLKSSREFKVQNFKLIWINHFTAETISQWID